MTDGLIGSRMPAKAESYIAFLDLCFVVWVNSNDAKKCKVDAKEGEEKGDGEDAKDGEGTGGDVDDEEEDIGGENQGDEANVAGRGGETGDLGLRSGRKWHTFGMKGFDVSEENECHICNARQKRGNFSFSPKLCHLFLFTSFGGASNSTCPKTSWLPYRSSSTTAATA